MNILASYPWIKEYLKTTATPQEFSREVSLRGPGVERLYDIAGQWDKCVVGKIVTVEKHPNADKLRVVSVDVGEKKPLAIVCGGSNLEVGQLVALARIGAKVRWHGQGELIELTPAEIRGVASEGMICASDELGLQSMYPAQGEKEIMDLTETKAKPGTALAEALGFEEPIMDIEVTTNRPDAYSIVGLAREAAAAGLGKFTWKGGDVKAKKGTLKVEVTEKELCTRYIAARVENVAVGQAPAFMKARLEQAGIRSINLVVDITNYVMLELGHPMHAFDAAKITGNTIKIRQAKKGENFLALDGKTYELKPGMLVIADAEKPIALAGVMGGEHSGTTTQTTSIILEAAAFNDVSVRRTSRSFPLITDASLRFEKALPEESASIAMARALELLLQYSPGAKITEVQDVKNKWKKPPTYSFRPEFANKLMGASVPAATMKKILTALGCEVKGFGKAWSVTVPWWRKFDIESERDLVEEVARIYGYFNIPGIIPGNLTGRAPEPLLTWEQEVKTFLEHHGLTELYSYSFQSAATLQKAQLNPEAHIAITNPLSTDFTHMRTQLWPSALEVIKQNQDRFPEGSIFELANVYHPKGKEVPEEIPTLLVGCYGEDNVFRKVQGIMEAMMEKYGVECTLLPDAKVAHLHPGRSASMQVQKEIIGTIGELHPSMQRAFGLDKRAAFVEINFAALAQHLTKTKRFQAVPEFPSVKRDVSFAVEKGVTHRAIMETLLAVSPLVVQAEKFDEFEGSVAYHLEFRAPDRTLSAEEADALLQQVRTALEKKHQATLRS